MRKKLWKFTENKSKKDKGTVYQDDKNMIEVHRAMSQLRILKSLFNLFKALEV
jgi:hypothetical protein